MHVRLPVDLPAAQRAAENQPVLHCAPLTEQKSSQVPLQASDTCAEAKAMSPLASNHKTLQPASVPDLSLVKSS